MIHRQLPLLAGLLSLLLVLSCEPTATGNSTDSATTDNTEMPATSEGTTGETAGRTAAAPQLTAPACAIEGEVMDGNKVWLKSSDMLAVVKADAETTNEEFGPSHRVFELLDGRSCESKFRTVLPENTSPDYPYYIAEIQYNNISKLVGIQGFYDAYVCDTEADYTMTKCSPAYFSEREYDDPQSGMIQRLEVWENYLLGYAQDCGAFAFDLSDPAKAVAVLPFAEWQDPDIARYHSLFLLPAEGGMQAIMPFYDAEEDAFLIYPIFDSPQPVSTNVPKSARNNVHLVLRSTVDNKPFPINLGERDMMDVPSNVLAQGTQEILAWMESQEK